MEGGSGGSGSGGNINDEGSKGETGIRPDQNSALGGQGGTSPLGTAGGNGRLTNGNGNNGNGYGSGGGGTRYVSSNFVEYTGGSGASGIVIVEEYY